MQIYQNIFENLSDGVIVIGFDSKIDTCNVAACEMFGIERGSATGKSIAELMIEIEGKIDAEIVESFYQSNAWKHDII